MREHVHVALQDSGYLTSLADLALRERAYIVTDAGLLREQVRFTPLRQAVRLIVNQARLLSPDIAVVFGGSGWQALKDAATVRNRITHPKTLWDMMVQADDIDRLRSAMDWILVTTEDVMGNTNLSLKIFNEEFRSLYRALKAGDSAAVALYEATVDERES